MAEDYINKDLEDSLRRAFVDRRFESILFDGWEAKNSFLRDGLNYGIDMGWLKVSSEVKESQYTAVNYCLTDKGKLHFGLSN